MGDFPFNQGKGAVTEWARRVEANDPANSVFVLAAFNTSATDATLRDLDTLAGVEADVNTAEATNAGYARKVLANGSLTVTVDDTNDRTEVDCADQTWTGVAASPGAWTDLGFFYDSDSTAGTDAAIVPATWHDFPVTPDSSDITAQIPGFFRAT